MDMELGSTWDSQEMLTATNLWYGTLIYGHPVAFTR